jgi:hydrogenase nickel incorporation protein HypA/HybF
MHELSVTQEILNIAAAKASEAGAASVKRINLVIGDMSSIVDDSVQFYFDIISQDSLVKGAELCFRRVPVMVRCRNCSNEYKPAPGNWDCPRCHRGQVDVIAGNEFHMDSIEVE